MTKLNPEQKLPLINQQDVMGIDVTGITPVPINLNKPIGKRVMPVVSKFPANNLPACVFVFPLLITPHAITLR